MVVQNYDTDIVQIKSFLQRLHFSIWDAVRRELMAFDQENSRRVAGKGAGDVSYDIDVRAEKIIAEFFTLNEFPGGVVIICEGLGERVFPSSVSSDSVRYRCIIDPIDGTRNIMYTLRSAWILTGIALNRGPDTNLSDILLSLQTEIPVPKQHISSVLWAQVGYGVSEEYWDITNRTRLQDGRLLLASSAASLEHGFSVFVNPFLGAKGAITALGDKITLEQVGEQAESSALVFHDEYISSAGQLYCIATGRYRLVADIRSKIAELLHEKGKSYNLCAHPYDLSTYLIATESGCIVTNLNGGPLTSRLDTDTNVGWIAYANKAIQKKVESSLLNKIKHMNV